MAFLKGSKHRAAVPRLLRDVCVSALATGVASLAFSHLSHEPEPRPALAGKVSDRLAGDRLARNLALSDSEGWAVEVVPVRQTRIYDTLAMFSLPLTTDGEWSTGPVELASSAQSGPADPAPAKPARSRQIAAANDGVQPGHVALPPTRPIVLAAASLPNGEPSRERNPIKIAGWAVPGQDVLLAGGELIEHGWNTLGGEITSVGATVAGSLKLK